MFRLIMGGGNRLKTCREIKNHPPGSKRAEFSDYTMKTLGSGDLQSAVKLPAGEDLNEWLAANVVDFFNEIRLIWDIVAQDGLVDSGPGTGFPPDFEYRWADSRNRTPISCSGPQYVNFVMDWIEGEINNEAVFPITEATPFPSSFQSTVRVIFTRIFRIFAIVYTHHYKSINLEGSAAHLNTSFKHFLFFCWEFDLVKDAELDALQSIVEEIRLRYNAPPPALKASARASSFDNPASYVPSFSTTSAPSPTAGSDALAARFFRK